MTDGLDGCDFIEVLQQAMMTDGWPGGWSAGAEDQRFGNSV